MIKLNRRYVLRVQVDDGGEILVIEPPFTLQFDITRKTFGTANLGQFRIINLSPLNRNKIRFNFSNAGTYRPIELRAGYGDNLPIVFFGNMTVAGPMREKTEFITQIECYDAGFAYVNGNFGEQIPAGTSQKDLFSRMIASMPYVKEGAIGDFTDVSTRSNSYSGNPAAMLSELSGGGFFIDNGVANVLKVDEYIQNSQGPAVVITPASGLLGTPLLEETIMRVQMLFEPQLNVGQLVKIEAFSNQNFNGLYRCIGVKHRGIISETVSGECITEAEFYYTKTLKGVVPGQL